MFRLAPLLLFSTTLCCTLGLSTTAQAQTAPAIPDHFFKEWSLQRDCSEPHAGIGGHVQTGLRFRVARDSVSQDGQTYALEPIDGPNQVWPGDWTEVRLEYRPGAPMEALPADFECIPGQESSSPFLAMSGYSQTAEPYYEYEHWYGLATIHGEAHHVLIFPRNVNGDSSAVILLHDADTGDNTQLDHNGSIIVHN